MCWSGLQFSLWVWYVFFFWQAGKGEGSAPGSTDPKPGDPGDSVGEDEVLSFPTNCPECNAPAETNMKLTGEEDSVNCYVN